MFDMKTAIEVDLSLCAKLIQTIADRLRDEFTPPNPNDSIHALVSAVRRKSAESALELRKALRFHYPEIAWGAEEDLKTDGLGDRYWTYDPIDGAYHYLQSLPLWSSSLTLVEHGRSVLAVVYEPVSRELFTAVAGQGAKVGSIPMRVSAKPELALAVLGTAIPPTGATSPAEQTRALALLDAMCKEVFVVRQMGSASLQLAYVAAGRLDGYWETGQDINDWLAGSLLITEAGGSVTSLSGREVSVIEDGIIAMPPLLHEPAHRILATVTAA
jgi:myo-inositol-1(or 4)-monophosphatase